VSAAGRAKQARTRLVTNVAEALQADGDVGAVVFAVVTGMRGHVEPADVALGDELADRIRAHFAETNGPDHG
jgi:hypothetical protein